MDWRDIAGDWRKEQEQAAAAARRRRAHAATTLQRRIRGRQGRQAAHRRSPCGY